MQQKQPAYQRQSTAAVALRILGRAPAGAQGPQGPGETAAMSKAGHSGKNAVNEFDNDA